MSVQKNVKAALKEVKQQVTGTKKSKKPKDGESPENLIVDKETSKKDEKEVWKYEGEKNAEDKPHGKGKLYNINTNEYYDGYWSNGKRDGAGTQSFATGEKYEGYFKDGEMHGAGSVTYPNKSTFIGFWENGKRVSGTLNFDNGDVTYKEAWKDDLPGPSGQLEYSDGKKYMGEVGYTITGKYTIKEFKIYRQGYGEMYWMDGNKYLGFWKNDKRKGFGVLVEKMGCKYYGHWSRSKKNGYGVEIMDDGTYYEGTFEKDERKGKGKLCLPNGDVILGEWNGIKVSNATYYTRKFTDVPRPLRAIFLSNVTAVQRTEDKSLFTSVYKWSAFVEKATQSITPDFQQTKIGASFIDEIKAKTGHPPLILLVDRFIEMFEWEFGSLKTPTKKDQITALGNAVDNLNSFISTLSEDFAQKLEMNYQTKKTVVEVLINAIFPKVYHILFPLYNQVHKMNESLLRAKISQLKNCTPALIGVKEKYHLNYEQKLENSASAPPTPAVSPASSINSGSSSGTTVPSTPIQPAQSTTPITQPSPTQQPTQQPQNTQQPSPKRDFIEESHESSEDKFKDHDSKSSSDLIIISKLNLSTNDRATTSKSANSSPRSSTSTPPSQSSSSTLQPSQHSPRQQQTNSFLNSSHEPKTTKGTFKLSAQREVSPAKSAATAAAAQLTSRNIEGDSSSPSPRSEHSHNTTITTDGWSIKPSPRMSEESPSQTEEGDQFDESTSKPKFHFKSSQTGESRANRGVFIPKPKSTFGSQRRVSSMLEIGTRSEGSGESHNTTTTTSNSSYTSFRSNPFMKSSSQSSSDSELNLSSSMSELSLNRSNSQSELSMNAQSASQSESESLATARDTPSSSSLMSSSKYIIPMGAENELKKEEERRLAEEVDEENAKIPYYSVIKTLERLNEAKTPISKLDCLTKGANNILKCVDKFYTDKTQNILMGAEDKFPVLIYALIRADVHNLWSHCYFLQDFVNEHIGDEESKYRASELLDALKYISSLDWKLRDVNNVLVPLKMILSAVAWSVKVSL
eukprot:TRINITY_DN1472_c2_g1_i1.p1 TRINITY_DN1472_c2_g1~~TRINITY_DN1472_c2_g1_i1.p1  ORF type:complete len:1025 (+),score=284.86 TRINITY_DN1472_c2_g1_i1:130-3204(+)